MSFFDDLYSGLVGMIARGRVTASQTGTRTLVQLQMLSGETKDRLELMMPYGMSANPAGGDAIAATVGNTRDHVVVLGVDDGALRIAALQPGEFGFFDGKTMMVFKAARFDLTSINAVNLGSDVQANIHAPDIEVSPDGAATYVLMDKRAMDLFNLHTHPSNGAPPSQQMAVGAHTTSGLKAG